MIVQKAPGNSPNTQPSKVVLPNYIPYGHSSTKWLLNTFRNAANNRLIAMVKEKPHMFRHTFQIFDNPAEVRADPMDTRRLFSSTTILYLKPLSLAVYMRCKSAVEILLESALCNSMEFGYASDVYVQSQGHEAGDLLELLPACIAVRRQFLEVLPLLFQITPLSHVSCSPRTSFSLSYISKRVQRTTIYDDIFHYATEVAQVNRHVNIVRTLDTLISKCPGFYTPGRLDENRKCELYSLFRRLVLTVLYVDLEGRICLPLIQCMDLLVRYSHFQPDAQTSVGGGLASVITPFNTFKNVRDAWPSLSDWTKDCYVSVALLFQLYAVLLRKPKCGSVGHAGNLLFRVLIETGCFDAICAMAIRELAATLDFVIQNDCIGRELQQDKKSPNPQKGRPVIEQGDCRSAAAFSFILAQDLLSLVVGKLKARHKLAQLRRMHLLCLARSNRMIVNGTQSLRSRQGPSRFTKSVRGKISGKPVYALRHQWPSHPYKFEQPTTSSVITESEPHGLLRAYPNTRKTGNKFLSKSAVFSEPLKASGHGRLHSTILNTENQLATEDKSGSLIPTITTTDADEDRDREKEELRSSLSDSSKTVPPPRSFQPVTISHEPAEDPSFIESCRIASDLGSASLDIPCKLNRLHHPASVEDVKPTVRAFTKLSESDQRASVPKAPHHANRKKGRGTQRLVNALFAQRPLHENMSLRDVDQLIDCITTSALANEQDLEGQLFEDLFDDYVDHDLVESDDLSCVNSVLGTHVSADQTEGAKTASPKEWASPSDMLDGCDSGAELNNVNTCQQRGTQSAIEIAHAQTQNSSTDLECYCTNPRNMNAQTMRSADTDTHGATNYRKFLWSCAKPICHLANAIEVFKQLSVSRRSASRTTSNRLTTTIKQPS